MSIMENIKKVKAAGFRVFRIHEESNTIRECTAPGVWVKIATEKNRSATRRVWDAYVLDPKNIYM